MPNTVFILGVGASYTSGVPLMNNFLDEAKKLLVSGSLSIEDSEHFSNVFRGISTLQSFHSKSKLDLKNLESLFATFEMASGLNKMPGYESDQINSEFEQYWEEQKILRLKEISEEENLDDQQFRNLMDRYIFSGKDPLNEEVFACMEARPSVLKAHEIGNRIIQKMREYVDVFVRGMVG